MVVITFFLMSLMGLALLAFYITYSFTNKAKGEHEQVRLVLSKIELKKLFSLATFNRSNGVTRTIVLVSGRSDIFYTEDLLAIFTKDNSYLFFDAYYPPILLTKRVDYWRRMLGTMKVFPLKRISTTKPDDGVLIHYLRSEGFGGDRLIEFKYLDEDVRNILLAFNDTKH